jgi:adenine-specific DNA-methyltransferase
MATNKLNKLELTWIGKDDERHAIEPRILVEDPTYSYGKVNEEAMPNGKNWDGNMLIHGDNLLALKALECDYSGKVQCIFIDPPYNTGSAFEHYDDNVEHSIWLSLMRERLVILHKLLSNTGLLWITLDDNEVHYCKVLCDEIYGRKNFLGDVIWQHSVQGKNDAKTFSVTNNHILVYSKTENFIRYKVPREAKHNVNYKNPDNDPKGPWRSGDVRSPNLRENLKFAITTPSGKTMNPPEKGWRWSKELLDSKIRSGEIFFSEDETRIIRKIYLADQDGRVPDTLWLGEDCGTTREANTELKTLNLSFGTPKPERLIERILNLSTKKGDIVLDSFLGSGTTAAVAHKMGRRWIGVEMGDHAYTHCAVRLKKVVDGTDQGGISKSQNWQGGGGFKFYELAPSLLNEDKFGNMVINKDYNADMLAAAMAKHEGFTYEPSAESYWKQGYSSEHDYIYTTTQFLTAEGLDAIHGQMGEDESLLICCTKFQSECNNRYGNITIKKIPKMLLDRCEFAKDDYSLNIVCPPSLDEDDYDDEDEIDTCEDNNEQSDNNNQSPQLNLFD